MKSDWELCNTVLLDMDGTLLDLSFDNYFWHEYVPFNFAKQHDIDVEVAKSQLRPLFKKMEGTIEWYCLDYWTLVTTHCILVLIYVQLIPNLLQELLISQGVD